MNFDWSMDSVTLGRLFLPFMERLMGRIPHLEAALLCTADGLNLCSIGAEPTQVGKLSALVSSIMSLGVATVRTAQAAGASAPPHANARLDTLILESGDMSIAGIFIPARVNLGLVVVANKATFGAMLVGLRQTAEEIEQLCKTRFAAV